MYVYHIIQTVGASNGCRLDWVSTSNHRISLEYIMNNRLVMLCVEAPLRPEAPLWALLDLGIYFR